MPEAYTIDSVWLGILSGFGGLLLVVAGWVARVFWKRMDRDQEQRDAKMDRNKAEVLDLIKQSAKRREEAFRAATVQREKLDKKMDANHEKLDKKIDGNYEKLDKKIDGKADATAARLESKMDRDKSEVKDLIQQSDKRSEGRDRQIQDKVHDLTYQVGRLDGVAGVQNGPAARSGQPSSRRNDNPSSPTDREPDPARLAERHARSMVPLAGVRPEPAVPAGLAGQAVPGQQQTGQEDDEPESEPPAQESPDTAP